MDKSSTSTLGALLGKLGAWMQPVSMAVAVFGLANASRAIRGTENPEEVSQIIGDMLHSALFAKTISLAGLVQTTVSITFYRYRAGWMFYFLCLCGLLMIAINVCLLFFTSFIFALHLSFGIFFVGFAAMKREEFQRAAAAGRRLPDCYKLDV